MSVKFPVDLSFDHQIQKWATYKCRLNQYFIANGVTATIDTTGEQRRAVLLSALHEGTFQLVADLALPKDVQDVPFEDIVALLDAHFTPTRVGFGERHKFFAANQEQGETHTQWAARLRGLTAHCAFQNVEEALRDKFIMGMLPGVEKEKLYAQALKDLTLAKAVEIAESMRCARANSAGASGASVRAENIVYKVVRGTKSGVNSGGKKEKCAVCGYSNHSTSECRFAEYACKKCNTKGHLRRMCRVKYVEMDGQTANGEDDDEVILQVIKTEDEKKDESLREIYMLDATDTAKAKEETNVLEKPIDNAKSEENITVTLPNKLEIFGSIKPLDKKRPNRHPIDRSIVPRRPTTSPLVSKLPTIKRGVSPIKTTVAKSSERNTINSAQTKTPIPRPKTPSKPKKLQSNVVPSRNITLPSQVVETIPKNVGQTTDFLQVDKVDGKDMIFFSDSNKSDIASSLVVADMINGTQNKEANSLDVVSKETKNKISDLPVINELAYATSLSEKLIYTPANTKVMSFDSTNSLTHIACVEHVNNPASNAWSNSAKQVPISDDSSNHNKVTSANEKPSSGQQQNPGMANDNVERPVTHKDTPNISITFTKPEFRNFSEFSDKSAKEPLMVLVNKGDIISLKLNVEVRNAEGVITTNFNTDTAKTGAKNTKGSDTNNNSRVSIHDEGKPTHSKAGVDLPHMCCPGNTVVVGCACCNCYQYQTEISGNDTKPINNNDPKTYFVVVPVLYGNERYTNSSGIARFEKGNQNAASLTKLNRTTSLKEPFILATAKSHENRPEPAETMEIQEILNQEGPNALEASRISFFIDNERNETTKQMPKLPDIKTRDSILVKRNISQTLRHVSEQHIPATVINPKEKLEDRSTQSEWHNVLMELRSAKDGHYTLHLPPLSTLRRYNVPPFE